MIYICSSM